MKPYQRKQLLERIGRDGATVGTSIPERITLEEEEIPLRSLVFDLTREGSPTETDRENAELLKDRLRRGRRHRRERLETADLAYSNAETLADEIVGIDRAIAQLEQLEPTDLEAAMERQQAQDSERWFRFLRKALGHDKDNTGGRGR